MKSKTLKKSNSNLLTSSYLSYKKKIQASEVQNKKYK